MKKLLKMNFINAPKVSHFKLLVSVLIIFFGKFSSELSAADSKWIEAPGNSSVISHRVPGSGDNFYQLPVTEPFEYLKLDEFPFAGYEPAIITDCLPVGIETQPVGNNLCTASGSASFNVVANGTFPFTYQWQYFNGSIWVNAENGTPAGALYTGVNTETLNVSGIITTGSFQYQCYITNCSGANNAITNTVSLTVNDTPTAPVEESIIQPTCSIVTGSIVLSGLPSGNWTINPGNHLGSGTSATISGIAAGTYNFTVTNVSGCTSDASGDMLIIAHAAAPIAKAGFDATFTGTPILIGAALNGPGSIKWSPAAGLNDTSFAQPLASPLTTTTYTLTVDNNGCSATDAVTITLGNPGHMINGKTIYAARASSGSYGNFPTYNCMQYNISNVIVILKNYPAGTEVARDTSDVLGKYEFTNVLDGNYMLSYNKYTADTMQWGNDVNAADVALLMYLIGVDTLADPSRCFSAKYKGAADIDNDGSINVIDVARLKSKIGAPYQVIKNFPKGNWDDLNTIITVAGSDVTINLETICNGDYNASSSKYRDSLTTWGFAKSLPVGIVVTSEEYITTSNPSYFEVPLKINSKMDDFSALGLELNYPNSDYKLVNAYMPGVVNKTKSVKINPTMEEIITNDNDLLVTDENGVIRVVYATTSHYDVAANDEMIILGFRSLKNMDPGELDFNLSGTGVISNQYGEENDEAYLTMPKIFVQGNNTGAGFELAGYPNPFKGETTITYNLPEAGTVKINIYNAIGELVSELMNETQSTGKYAVKFSPENLPEGMYTFKLEYEGPDNSQCLNLKMIH